MEKRMEIPQSIMYKKVKFVPALFGFIHTFCGVFLLYQAFNGASVENKKAILIMGGIFLAFGAACIWLFLRILFNKLEIIFKEDKLIFQSKPLPPSFRKTYEVSTIRSVYVYNDSDWTAGSPATGSSRHSNTKIMGSQLKIGISTKKNDQVIANFADREDAEKIKKFIETTLEETPK
jgi:hypothetical protein